MEDGEAELERRKKRKRKQTTFGGQVASGANYRSPLIYSPLAVSATLALLVASG